MSDFTSTLDTVIALVVVLLFLGFVVQAIQSFIKKIFKLKSKEIEKSLTQLFRHVMDNPAEADDGVEKEIKNPTIWELIGLFFRRVVRLSISVGSFIKRLLVKTPPAEPPDPTKPKTPVDLTNEVLEQFKAAGRYTKWGKTVLESISKEDLLKVLARIDSKHFFADYVSKFSSVSRQITALVTEIKLLIPDDPTTTPSALRGVASSRIAEMNEVLTPLINDFKSIVEGENVKAAMALGDLLDLRRIKLDDALKLLSDAQEAVSKDLQAARNNKNQPEIDALETLSGVLTRIAVIIGKLGQEVDLAFAALRLRLNRVEQWYDTMMQSFEERYSRHMKNVSLYISIAVVIFLNASFFRVYQSISTNDQQRELLLKAGEKWLDERNAERKQANANTANTASNNATSNTTSNTESNTTGNIAGNTNGNNNSTGNTNANGNTSSAAISNGNANRGGALSSNQDTSSSSTTKTTIKELKEDLADIQKLTDTYQDFGFSLLSLQQVGDWLKSLTDFKGGNWWRERWRDIRHAIGWLIMVLLLSIGAPFWQDTLESLFGLKNLLRKRSDTRVIEQRSGEGQPRGQ